MGCDRLDPKGMEASRLEMLVVGGGRWRSMITGGGRGGVVSEWTYKYFRVLGESSEWASRTTEVGRVMENVWKT